MDFDLGGFGSLSGYPCDDDVKVPQQNADGTPTAHVKKGKNEKRKRDQLEKALDKPVHLAGLHPKKQQRKQEPSTGRDQGQAKPDLQQEVKLAKQVKIGNQMANSGQADSHISISKQEQHTIASKGKAKLQKVAQLQLEDAAKKTANTLSESVQQISGEHGANKQQRAAKGHANKPPQQQQEQRPQPFPKEGKLSSKAEQHDNGKQQTSKPAGSSRKPNEESSKAMQTSSQSDSKQQTGGATSTGGSKLLEKMRARLQSGHFRYLNEQLYTCSGDAALSMMKKQPSLFNEYHSGFQNQVHGWPVKPVAVAAAWLSNMPDTLVVADFGCGDASLSKSVKQTVHSFDLVACAPGVVACNMAQVPLESASVDVAVFSLALMGTDYGSYLEEANRVLKPKGWLWIAEVRSRFTDSKDRENFKPFLNCLTQLGFVQKHQDASNTMFVVWRLQKVGDCKGTPNWPTLKACTYKKR